MSLIISTSTSRINCRDKGKEVYEKGEKLVKIYVTDGRIHMMIR